MITVFPGVTWAAERDDFAGDDCGRVAAGRTGLVACAQLGEHWQQKPAARRADKQMKGFTAGRLIEKHQDLRQPRFWVQVYIW